MESKEISSVQDERLANALAFSNYRLTLNLQRKNALLKLQNDLMYSTDGGTFEISQELISFVFALVQLGKSSATILDKNNNPISITDLEGFLEECVDRYYQHTNGYLVVYKDIQKKRSTQSLVDIT